MNAQLHHHILVVYHLHPGDIPFQPVGLELIFLLVGQEVVDRVLQPALVATDPRCDGLLGGLSNSITVRSPLCRQRTLDPKKISAMALNSTRPERGTSLILYRGAVVTPRCSSRARSLTARIEDSAPKDSTSSASRYIFSALISLGGGCSLSVLSSMS
jgi:hypothetical protein